MFYYVNVGLIAFLTVKFRGRIYMYTNKACDASVGQSVALNTIVSSFREPSKKEFLNVGHALTIITKLPCAQGNKNIIKSFSRTLYKSTILRSQHF